MGHIETGATFSPDRKYRYDLWRVWDKSLPRLNVIGLNPSTADETEDDPTIRRCISFAQDMGYGQLHMLNIFAFRSTDPRRLLFPYCDEPVGEDNDKTLAALGPCPVCAWGNWGKIGNRSAIVRRLLTEPLCFGLTGENQPKHPLYLPKTAKLVKLI